MKGRQGMRDDRRWTVSGTSRGGMGFVNRMLVRRRCWLITAMVVLYAGGISHHWRPFPDSASYLLLAESIAEGNGYAINGQPHGKYPPGLPVYLAVMDRIGLGDMFTLNILMSAIALLALLACYFYLRQLTSPRGAFLATLVIATLFEMYRLSGAQLTDVPFLLLVTAGAGLLLKGQRERSAWMEVGSILLLASCWFRVLGIPVCIATAAGLLLQCPPGQRKRALWNVSALVVGAFIIGFLLFSRDRAVNATVALAGSYSAELSAVTDSKPYEWMWQLSSNFLGSGVALSKFFTGQKLPAAVALIIFWVPIVFGAIIVGRRGQYVPLFGCVGYLGSILILREPLARYFLPMAPVLILCLGQGLRWATLYFMKGRWRLSTVVTVGALLLMACNLPKDIRRVFRTHHPDWTLMEGRQHLFQTAEYLRSALPGDGRFVTSRYANMLSYLSGKSCLPSGLRAVDSDQRYGDVLEELEELAIQYVVLWPGKKDVIPLRNMRVRDKPRQGWQIVFRSGRVTILGRSPDSRSFAGGDRARPKRDVFAGAVLGRSSSRFRQAERK
ncbi:MAG: hypothetical protein R6U98_14390 [Pirellulaceae bacterium]